MDAALKLIPARTWMVRIEGAAHDLVGRKPAAAEQLAQTVLKAFEEFFGQR
jgi:hypothetical protein